MSTSSKANHQGTESESVPPRLAALLLAPLLLLLALPVGAQEWKAFSQVPGEETHYIDLSSIRVTGHMRRVWTLADLSSRNQYGAQSQRSLVEVDCKEQRIRALTYAELAEPMGRGKVLRSENFDPPDRWFFAVPGSTGAHLVRTVCAVKK